MSLAHVRLVMIAINQGVSVAQGVSVVSLGIATVTA